MGTNADVYLTQQTLPRCVAFVSVSNRHIGNVTFNADRQAAHDPDCEYEAFSYPRFLRTTTRSLADAIAWLQRV